MTPPEKIHQPRAAFRYRDFRRFLSARFLALCAHQMMIVAVSQAVYELTHSPLNLGYIGLALFFPKIGFTLIAGHTADRFDRRLVILVCRIVEWVIVTVIAVFAFYHFQPLWALYALLFLLGTAHAFDGPPSQAIVTQLVHADHFDNAVSWNLSSMQIAFILGPAIGGWLYAWLGKAVYVLAAVSALRFFSILLIAQVRPRTDHISKGDISVKSLMAGLRYVFEKKIILGAISLDLFAVLLGGATALLPIYANEILKIGPTGLGMLRAAPPVGAAIMAIVLAHRPPLKNAGKTMFFAIILFGLSTIIFGLSKSFILSMICLVILGASDMVSVVIRGVLVQMKTPPAMRGRVSAVNMVFIGASNELGEFESGLTANWLGTITSVVLGGIGTLAVVALAAWKFPELREYKRLDEAVPPEIISDPEEIN
jgi:MFS family permease